MSITISNNAAIRINSFIKKNHKAIGIRIKIQKSGCSGMAYKINLVDFYNKEDNIFEDKGIKIIIDNKSLLYIKGTKLDFIKNEFNEYFKFDNPNVKNECGCGESFNIL